MNMKLWNFLERIQSIENKIVYVENHYMEQDPCDGMEYHSIQINVEDANSETIEASFLVEENSLEALQKTAKFLMNEYFEGEEIVENW